MPSNQRTKFVILAVLDGWGMAANNPGNAITQANTKNIDKFWLSYPHTTLEASGEAVGLPRGEDGNTETGHLNLGAGSVVYQDLARINMSIADGSFFDNKVFMDAIAHAKKYSSKIHLLGLVGAGGVHSNIDHLIALIDLVKRNDFSDLYVHVITDGRDSPPTLSQTYIDQIKHSMEAEGVGRIASVMGRYWAMDRDRRWERTQRAYNALTKGEGHLVKTAEEGVNISYTNGLTDEFIEPSLISNSEGLPIALINDNDVVIFFNFRIDRPRQLTAAFLMEELSKGVEGEFDPYLIDYQKSHLAQTDNSEIMMERGTILKNLYFVTMTEYSRALTTAGAKVAFPPTVIREPLGKAIADAGLKQLRVSESEKERFVTFYFNGQNGEPYEGEERIIIPSPKVPTYDQKPEMSAALMTDTLLSTLKSDPNYAFILINYPNADMVGHTGNIGPAVKACEVVDECVGRLADFTLAFGGTLLLTADHGNAEEMINSQTGEIDTEHSTNPVPFIAVSQGFLGKNTELTPGVLADVAPTVLALLGINKPDSMKGKNLLSVLDH